MYSLSQNPRFEKCLLSEGQSTKERMEQNQEGKMTKGNTKKNDEIEPSYPLHALLEQWNLCTS